MEWHKDQYTINTDKSLLDVGMIHHFLYTTAHWAIGRPMNVVKKSIEGSLCFGVYEGEKQLGFARIVTDGATVGWICDMFILPAYRNQGLGAWLVDCMMQHPDVKGLRRILLNTAMHTTFTRNTLAFASCWRLKAGWKNSTNPLCD